MGSVLEQLRAREHDLARLKTVNHDQRLKLQQLQEKEPLAAVKVETIPQTKGKKRQIGGKLEVQGGPSGSGEGQGPSKKKKGNVGTNAIGAQNGQRAQAAEKEPSAGTSSAAITGGRTRDEEGTGIKTRSKNVV